jgi:putative membrane protein
MIRLLVRIVVALAANAVGLLVAAALLDDFEVDFAPFVVAVVIFTVVFALLQPFLAAQLGRGGALALLGATLLATLISLIVTDLLSDGFTIDGVGTWITATVIVWIASLLAAFVIPFLGLRRFLKERRD